MTILHTNDTTYQHLNGMEVDILRTITEANDDYDQDVLPMIEIEVGGEHLTVWPDELKEGAAK